MKRFFYPIIAFALPFAAIAIGSSVAWSSLGHNPLLSQELPTWQVCTMDVSGAKIEMIAQNVPFARSLDWSVNKLRRSVYLRAVDAENDIFVYNFETKTETRIPKPGFQL